MLKTLGADYKISIAEIPQAIVNTDASGNFTFTLVELKTVHAAMVSADNGYKAEVTGINGNEITVTIYNYNYPSASAGTAQPVVGGYSLCNLRVVAFGE